MVKGNKGISNHHSWQQLVKDVQKHTRNLTGYGIEVSRALLVLLGHCNYGRKQIIELRSSCPDKVV